MNLSEFFTLAMSGQEGLSEEEELSMHDMIDSYELKGLEACEKRGHMLDAALAFMDLTSSDEISELFNRQDLKEWVHTAFMVGVGLGIDIGKDEL